MQWFVTSTWTFHFAKRMCVIIVLHVMFVHDHLLGIACMGKVLNVSMYREVIGREMKTDHWLCHSKVHGSESERILQSGYKEYDCFNKIVSCQNFQKHCISTMQVQEELQVMIIY